MTEFVDDTINNSSKNLDCNVVSRRQSIAAFCNIDSNKRRPDQSEIARGLAKVGTQTKHKKGYQTATELLDKVDDIISQNMKECGTTLSFKEMQKLKSRINELSEAVEISLIDY